MKEKLCEHIKKYAFADRQPPKNFYRQANGSALSFESDINRLICGICLCYKDYSKVGKNIVKL